jgi:hypothetical protein
MLRISVTPESIDVAPGAPIDVTVALHNDGAAGVVAATRFVGVDPAWVEGLPSSVTVAPGERVEIPVRVTLPPGYPAGAHLVGFEAEVEGRANPLLAPMQLVVASLDGISLGLSPASFRGGFRGRFRLNLINRGDRPVHLKLTGRDAGQTDDDPSHSTVSFTFKPDELTLHPGERVRTRGQVSARRPVIGSSRTRAMTIVAHSTGAPIHAAARFTQRPLLSRRLLRVVSLFVVLSMWAGALVTTVRWNQHRRTETAASASATVDSTTTAPGGGGGSGAGGDGKGGADGGANGGADGGSEGGTPTGATISGQVSGIPDRAGVRVDLRPVSLADALPTSTNLTASGVQGPPGKLYAQALGEQPRGPVAPTRSTVTDEQGFWAFAGLDAPANYEVTLAKAGFGTKSYVVAVDEKGGNVTIEVPMAAGDGALSGSVVGPDGPLGGVTITVTDGTVTYTTTTPTTGSGIGTWSVSGLGTPASYLVTAERRGFGTETVSVSLGGSESRSGVDLALVPGVGSISGVVTGDAEAVGGIVVSAASDTLTRTVTTLTDDPVGSFSLPQLPVPGSYTLTVSGGGWVSQTLRVDLTGNETGVDFDLVATTGSISGVVSDKDGPLSAVGITVSQDDPLVKTLSAVDPPGSYELSGLLPGTYVVTFERFGYVTQSTIVEVEAGAHEVADMTLEASPASTTAGSATVRGIVRSGTTGNPIAGVAVVAGSITATSGSDGSFVLSGLAVGTYDVAFTHARHQATSRTVRLAQKADVTIDVTMLPFGGVQGQVTDLTATALSGVTVSVAAATGTAAVTVPSATTDASGQYSILESLPTGSYVLTFSKAGYQTRTRSFESAAGTVTTVDMTLLELAAISGTIQEPATGVTGGFALLTGATITVSSVSTSGALTTVTSFVNTTGEYEVHNLEPGSYRITATKSGYGTVTKDLTDLKLRDVADGSVILTPGAQTVTGRVYWVDHTNTRQPISGATITTNAITGFRTLVIFPFVLPQTQTLTTTSDANGNWSMFGPTAGSSSNYSVTAVGFTSTTKSIAVPTTSGAGDIEMTPVPHDIVGTFTLDPVVPSGTTDVTVTASITSPALTTARPNESIIVRNNGAVGTYRFLNLTSPATYTVTLSATGYHNRVITVLVPASTAATVVTPPATTLQKHSSIGVTVRSSAATNPLLSGVTVTLAGPSNGVVTTAAAGTASFATLLPGAYTITLDKAGYETQVINRTIVAGEDVTLSAILARFSAVTVSVFRNKNGVLPTPALSGATVVASVGGVDTPLVEVGSTGVYSVDSLAPGTYAITASKALHDPASVSLTVVAGNDYARSLTLAAWSDAVVTVQSTIDGTGSNLAGATVTAARSGGATTTLADAGGGSYTTSSLQPGTYTFTATKAGHDAASVSGVVVTAGSDVAQTLSPARWPDLTVTLQGALDGATPALAGATVTATATAGGATRTLTDAGGGSYSASSLAPGTYTLTATKTGYDDAVAISGLVAVAGTSIATQPMTLQRWPTLTVSVSSDLDGTPSALTGAVVTATPTAGGAGARTLTDAGGGSYTATSLAPGTYTLTATKAGHDDAVAITGLGVVAGTTNATQALTLERWPNLAITVRSKLGALAPGAAGATVTATPTSGGAGARTLTDAGGGSYAASSLAPGTYTLTATKANHDDAVAITGLVVTAGTSIATQTLDLLRWPDLAVTATSKLDAATPGLAGATVTATPTSGGAGARSLTDGGGGAYSAASLAPGTYTVSASKANHDAASTSIVVTAGVALSAQTLDLLRWPDLSVTARSKLDTDVPGLGGATVTATPTAVATVTRSLTDGGGGAYSAASLAPGTYSITATKTPGWDAASPASITVTAGVSISAQTLDLLRWPNLVVNTLSNDNGTSSALDGATVVATPTAGGGTVKTLTASAGGVHTQTFLQPGTYTLTATKSADHNAATPVTGVVVTAGTAITGSPYSMTLDMWPSLTLALSSSAGGALSNVVVTAYLMSGATRTATTYSMTDPDADGTYTSVTRVQPGAYEIDASADNHTSATVTGITVTAGGAPYAGTLVLQRFSGVTLTVNELANGVSTGFDGATTVKAYRLNNGGQRVNNATPIDFHTISGAPVGDWTTSVNLSPASYEIEATGPTHTTTIITITAVAGTNLTPTLTLPKWPTVTVTVRGATTVGTTTTYASITDATVTATPTSGGATPTFTNNANGTYTAILQPGTYTISAARTGYTTVTSTGNVATAGGAYLTLSPDLPSLPGTISGTVRKVDGTALAGVTVSGQSSGTSIGTPVTTDANGAFTFTNVAPVTWTLTYQKATYGSLTQAVTVPRGGTVNGDAVLVELGGTITGATTGQASSEVGNSGANALSALSGVTVDLAGPTNASQTVQSDGSGNYVYSFGGIPSGSYTLTFSKAGYQTAGPISVTLSAAQVLTRNQTLTRTTGQVTVTTERATTTSRTITEDPQVAYTLSGPLITDHTVTAVAGVATFTNVPPGSGYTVAVSTLAAGLLEVVAGSGSVGAVSDGGANTSYSEVFTEVGTVSGTVKKDSGGGPVNADGATMTLTGTSLAGASVSLTTSSSGGAYSFSNVPRSDATGYTVTAALAGFPNGTSSGNAVARNATTTVGLNTLNEAPSLVVTVHDDAGAAVSGATVAIADGATPAGSTTSDGTGVARFTSVTAGTTYTITTTKTGYFAGSGSQIVTAVGAASITVTMDREVTLTFTVTDSATSNPLNGATVQLAGASTASGTTNASGVATITGVRPGSISATVTLTGYDNGSVAAATYSATGNPNAIGVTLTATPPPTTTTTSTTTTTTTTSTTTSTTTTTTTSTTTTTAPTTTTTA